MTDIKKFIAGYQRFHENYFSNDHALYQQLKQGQNPSTLVVACSDSRVDPAILLDCEPGDLFVVRNVANLVPPYETGGGLHGVSTALEFGVCFLGVQHIIVLGHSGCGGISALMHGLPQKAGSEFIENWVNIARPARDRVEAELPHGSDEDQCAACELASIQFSLENLLTFPWIRERVQLGELVLHGWYFNLETGELLAYSPLNAKYEPLWTQSN